MMRIAIFTNAYKPIVSGVVNTIDLMKNAYRAKGHEVYIFAPGFFDYVDEEENVYRYKWVNLTWNVKFPIAIPISVMADKVIKGFNPDIIHTHHPFVLGNMASYYSKKLDIPLVFTFHTQYEMYSHYVPLPSNLVKNYCRNTIINFSTKCDAITTPAQSIAGLLGDYGINKPVNVIPNAIDLTSYNSTKHNEVEKLKHEYGLEGKKVVISVGRIAPEKNLIFLIQAFKRALQANRNIKLLIVGDGPQMLELKSFVESNRLSGDVIFTGMIDYTKIPLFYKAADVFAITSVTEVKPLVILEALAAGLPIAAVDAPGAADTLTHMHDGLLSRCELKDFSNALLRILQDDTLYGRLKAGAVETAERYSIDRISEDYLSLYERLLKQNIVASAI